MNRRPTPVIHFNGRWPLYTHNDLTHRFFRSCRPCRRPRLPAGKYHQQSKLLSLHSSVPASVVQWLARQFPILSSSGDCVRTGGLEFEPRLSQLFCTFDKDSTFCVAYITCLVFSSTRSNNGDRFMESSMCWRLITPREEKRSEVGFISEPRTPFHPWLEYSHSKTKITTNRTSSRPENWHRETMAQIY